MPIMTENPVAVEHQKQNENVITGETDEISSDHDKLSFPEPKTTTAIKADVSPIEDEIDGKKTLRFREKVPKFIDKEFEVYGPYEQNEVVNLPSDLAHILIRNGKAEEVVQE
jgi:hypothetical protein